MAALVLVIALIPAVVVDLRRRIIPDAVVIPALAAVLVIGALGEAPWWEALASAVLVGLLLLVPALICVKRLKRSCVSRRMIFTG